MTISTPILKSNSLSPEIKLRHIIATLPKEVFIKNPWKAWSKLLFNIGCVVLGYFLLAISPWYLLPLVWIFQGTSLIGLFVIGHDCGHRSFSNRLWVNDLVGHLVFLPVIYPYHAWRILHNHHHKHTNQLDLDNTWNPSRLEEYNEFTPTMRWWYRRIRGKFWWIGSITHWATIHFSWWNFEGKQRQQIRFSALLAIMTGAIAFPIIFYTLGIWGFIKFWLLPWMVYHFWMSTFTIVHHTLPSIPFRPEGEWNEAEAQLCGTVHCKYPWWVEFLCHDINVHIPHHLTTAIPWYNLRKAHASLEENWGQYLHRREFSWSLIKEFSEQCYLYDKEDNYQIVPEYRK